MCVDDSCLAIPGKDLLQIAFAVTGYCYTPATLRLAGSSRLQLLVWNYAAAIAG